MKQIVGWVKKHRLEVVLLSLLILITLALRLYHIDQYMTFLGDEGRDAIVIKRILVDHRVPLLGPPMSVGNLYLGPLYYYMMAVAMAVWWLNPIAAAAMAALIGTAAVFLIYYLARQWFGFWPAIVAATLYSVSPVNIIYSRSSWNPNPAPFFALLAMSGMYKVHQTRNFSWFILPGGALAFAIHMHYLSLILLPIFGLLWLFEVFGHHQKKTNRKVSSGTLIAITVFLFLMTPLVIFDFRHDFMNYHALLALFGNQDSAVSRSPFDIFGRVWPIYNQSLVGRYMATSNSILGYLLSVLVVLPVIWAIYRKAKNQIIEWPYLALSVWLIVGLFGLSLYRQTVYDHYLIFMNPVPYLLLASLLGLIWKWRAFKKIGVGVIVAVCAVTFVFNLLASPLQYPPNNQLQRTQNIARFVVDQAGGRPFNFALIAAQNYDSAYQYYLDIYGNKAKLLPNDTTDQLFVVCEDKVCLPVGHPKYEIAAFGWTQIDFETEIGGVKVFKLIPYQLPH